MLNVACKGVFCGVKTEVRSQESGVRSQKSEDKRLNSVFMDGGDTAMSIYRENSGQWAVGSGQWAVGSGQWAVGNVFRPIFIPGGGAYRHEHLS